jgi:hypothetical protein
MVLVRSRNKETCWLFEKREKVQQNSLFEFRLEKIITVIYKNGFVIKQWYAFNDNYKFEKTNKVQLVKGRQTIFYIHKITLKQ